MSDTHDTPTDDIPRGKHSFKITIDSTHLPEEFEGDDLENIMNAIGWEVRQLFPYSVGQTDIVVSKIEDE